MFLPVGRFLIDRIDDLLYTLLRARFMISTRTVLYKSDKMILDEGREKNILARFDSGSLDKLFVEQLWRLIFSHSKHLQYLFLNHKNI
jgi:chorismate mutase